MNGYNSVENKRADLKLAGRTFPMLSQVIGQSLRAGTSDSMESVSNLLEGLLVDDLMISAALEKHGITADDVDAFVQTDAGRHLRDFVSYLLRDKEAIEKSELSEEFDFQQE